MPDPIIVAGLTASGLVILGVQVAKMLGLPPSLAPWLALLLSFLAVGANLLVQFVPEAQQFVEAAVAVLTVFLLSTGGYHAIKNVGGSVANIVQSKGE